MPNLIIIAGCNGAGKSTFATSFLQDGLTSFDYDRLLLEIYNSMPDSELRDEISKNEATKEFEKSVEKSLNNKSDFCYETNFDALPLFWAKKFRENGYQINLIFFCLSNQEIAKHRVRVRTEFKGHFVDNKTIDIKWKAGYKNLNMHFRFFDNLLIVDNSKQNELYSNILQIEGGSVIQMIDELPEYFPHRLPDICNLLKTKK
jgi:predicted ABC-type ATPase